MEMALRWTLICKFPSLAVSTLLRHKCKEYIITVKADNGHYIAYVIMDMSYTENEMLNILSGMTGYVVPMYESEAVTVFNMLMSHKALWLPVWEGDSISEIVGAFLDHHSISLMDYMKILNPYSILSRPPMIDIEQRNMYDGSLDGDFSYDDKGVMCYFPAPPPLESFSLLSDTSAVPFPLPCADIPRVPLDRKRYATVEAASCTLAAMLNGISLSPDESIERICKYSVPHRQMIFIDTYMRGQDSHDRKVIKLALSLEYMNIHSNGKNKSYTSQFWQSAFAVVPREFIDMLIPRSCHFGEMITIPPCLSRGPDVASI